MNETQRNINRYRAALPGIRERIVASAMLLLVSLSMVVSASFAWYTLSVAPEVSTISTTVAANGNLEIALVGPEGDKPEISQVGDSAAAKDNNLVKANLTWGNLVNLSDISYGLSEISLRPALISGYNMTRAPLYGATYGKDGRVEKVSETYEYTTYTDFGAGNVYFAGGDKMKHGVRAVSSVKYENATGASFEAQIMESVNKAYADTLEKYAAVVDNQLDVGGMKSMDALCKLLEIYVDEQAVRKLSNASYTADYAGVVHYMYNLVNAFCTINDQEGVALCDLTNLVAYKAGTVTKETLFKDIDAVVAAHKDGTLKSTYKVDLASLDDSIGRYVTNRDNIYKAREELSEYSADSYKPTSSPSGIYWNDIKVAVGYLVNIDEATIAEKGGKPTKIKNISSLGTAALATMVMNASASNPVEVVITEGALADTEQRLGSLMNGTVMKIPVNLKEGVPILGSYKGTIHAKVKTDATTANPPYNNYLSYYDRETAAAGSFEGQGDAVSKETYGMAMDLWLRTNTAGVNLVLEGNVISTSEQATCVARNGEIVPVFTATFEDRLWELYRLTEDVEGENQGETAQVTNWYNAATHVLVKTQEEMDAAEIKPDPKMIEIVTGYEGENRIWEDFLTQVNNGVIPEESTTQGAGSCYVFYANPTDQTRILELLKSFTVAFLDQKGNNLATACLDTERAYAINGKVTVPLKLIESQTTYEVEIGINAEGEPLVEERLAICSMEQNQETWITALVYLDGMRLTNEQVLSAGEIEGRLNLQFASASSLTAGKNEDLLYDSRSITAQAYFTGDPSNKSPEKGNLEAKYDGTDKKVTVELTVTGTHPGSMSAFFIRKISDSQGSRMKSVDFARIDGTNTWIAEFDLSKPGEYVMQSVIADGVEYRLEKTGTNVAAESYYPTVIIDGLGVTSVRCTYDTGNGTMGAGTGSVLTANSYVDVNVSIGIDAVPELMPKQVRAIFLDTNGKEFSAILSYANNTWSGSARITSSGTYTLTYVVMDGEYENLFDEAYSESFHPSVMVTLGLQAEVGCLNMPDGAVEFRGSYPLDMTVRILDDAGNELRGLTGLKLVYHSATSDLDINGMYAEMRWYASGEEVTLSDGRTWISDGRYYRVMNMDSPGNFSFDRVDVKVVEEDGTETESSISKAIDAPAFSCYSKNPPAFVANDTDPYQFAPENLGRLKNSTKDAAGNVITDGNNTTSGATMGVVLKNAEAAKIWAVIENQRGEAYLVESKGAAPGYSNDLGKDSDGNNQTQFIFDVPKNDVESNFYVGEQDGQWTLKALCFQNVYIPGATEEEEGTMYGAGTAPSLDPDSDAYYQKDGICYVIDVQDNTTKVVETVKVSAVKDGNAYKGATFGKTDGEVTGTFLTQNKESGVVLKLTDWDGKPVLVRGENADEDDGILEFVWTVTYQNNPSSYGHYTTDKASEGDRQINLTATYDSAAGGYKVPEQIYQFAGTYNTTSIKFTYGNSDYAKTYDFMGNTDQNDDLTVSYEVWSKRPTVTVTGTTPAKGTVKRVYTVKKPATAEQAVQGDFFRFTDYSATVYIHTPAIGGGYDQEAAEAYAPEVTLKLSDVPLNYTKAEMLFETTHSDSQNSLFEFNASGVDSAPVGKAVNGERGWFGVDKYPECYPAGRMDQNMVTIVYGDVTYTMELSHTVTIDQPQSPSVLKFVGIPETFTGTKPAQVQGEGSTVTVTFPELYWTATYDVPKDGTWSAYKSIGEVTDENGSPVGRVYSHKYWTTKNSCGGTDEHNQYQYYIWTKFESEITATTETYTKKMKIVQWVVDGVTYNAGETVEITKEGIISATAVAVEDGTNTTTLIGTETKTVKKHLYGYVKETSTRDSMYDGEMIGSRLGQNDTYVSPKIADSTKANAATDTPGTNMTTDSGLYDTYWP